MLLNSHNNISNNITWLLKRTLSAYFLKENIIGEVWRNWDIESDLDKVTEKVDNSIKVWAGFLPVILPNELLDSV